MADLNGDMLVRAAIEALPAVIKDIKTFFAKADPEQPPPTDAAVIAALNEAYARSLTTDEAWLAAHPAADDQAPPTI